MKSRNKRHNTDRLITDIIRQRLRAPVELAKEKREIGSGGRG